MIRIATITALDLRLNDKYSFKIYLDEEREVLIAKDFRDRTTDADEYTETLPEGETESEYEERLDCFSAGKAVTIKEAVEQVYAWYGVGAFWRIDDCIEYDEED